MQKILSAFLVCFVASCDSSEQAHNNALPVDIVISLPTPEIPLPTVDLDASVPDTFCIPGEWESFYDGPSTTRERGTCSDGMRVCNPDGADMTVVIEQVLPVPETCNGLDDDCDGVVDIPACGISFPCNPGALYTCFTGPMQYPIGECRPGFAVCNSDGMTFGPCLGEVLPRAETCDGLDNDCDGDMDEISHEMLQTIGLDEECLGWANVCQTTSLPDGSPCSVGVCVYGRCVPPHCLNETQDANETDIDCGGGICRLCGQFKACVINEDCLTGLCIQGTCDYYFNIVPTEFCDDGIQNWHETDVDCGGSCWKQFTPDQGGGYGEIRIPCENGKKCKDGDDCMSDFCPNNMCATSTCFDGFRGLYETDVDCGGICIANCSNGLSCLGDWDCQSGSCAFGQCVP